MKRYLQDVGIWAIIFPLAILKGALRKGVLVKLGAPALPLSETMPNPCTFGVVSLGGRQKPILETDSGMSMYSNEERMRAIQLYIQ